MGGDTFKSLWYSHSMKLGIFSKWQQQKLTFEYIVICIVNKALLGWWQQKFHLWLSFGNYNYKVIITQLRHFYIVSSDQISVCSRSTIPRMYRFYANERGNVPFFDPMSQNLMFSGKIAWLLKVFCFQNLSKWFKVLRQWNSSGAWNEQSPPGILGLSKSPDLAQLFAAMGLEMSPNLPLATAYARSQKL